jgi:hypothetical protein
MSKVLSIALLVSLVSTCALPMEETSTSDATPTDAGAWWGSEEAQELTRMTGAVEELELDAPSEVAPPASVRMIPRLGVLNAGVLLSRMAVNEGVSLMPLRTHWELDMQGILQVVRNNQWTNEDLQGALGRHSPHVARLRDYTRPRQRWTSTLSGRGDSAPEFWVECTSWSTDGLGHKVGSPIDCDGVWLNGVVNWKTVREYGALLVAMDTPPRPVQGNPKAWGGAMDLARFLERNPNMCWLESGGTLNYFFGLKDDPENQCKHVPRSLVQISKLISARLVVQNLARSSRDRQQRRQQEATAIQDGTAGHEAL